MNDRPHGNQKSLAPDDGFVAECLRYLDREMSPDELVSFQQRLEADKRLQVAFARLMVECEMVAEACDAQRADDLVKMADVYARGPFLAGRSVKESAHLFSLREVFTLAGYMVWQGLRAKSGVIGSIAAVLLIGAVLYLSILGPGQTPAPQDIADNTPTKPADSAKPTPRESERHAVATLTNTHNATWASASLATGTKLHPGTRLTLTAGFAEITTARGAIAILQAPATIEILNNNALRLHTGKLVGICETPSSKGFVVKTAHADITDLGTEFGVQASEDRGTDVCVFFGEVLLERRDPDGSVVERAELTTHQAAHVDQRITMAKTAAAQDIAERFTRPDRKVISLADIIAGGDGTQGKRDAGIDPATATYSTTEPTQYTLDTKPGYRPFAGSDLIDGVFVPNGPGVVNSNGDRWEQAPITSGERWAYIWAGGRLPHDFGKTLSAQIDGVDYSKDGRTCIDMVSNKGITFDLNAIAAAHGGKHPMRFQTVVANTYLQAYSLGAGLRFTKSAFHVLVDGKPRRATINFDLRGPDPKQTVQIDLQLNPGDRYLTLVSTDGGDGIGVDWIVLGDPVLVLER